MFDISNGCNTCEPFAATVPDNQYVNMNDNFGETSMNNVNNNYNDRIRNNAGNNGNAGNAGNNENVGNNGNAGNNGNVGNNGNASNAGNNGNVGNNGNAGNNGNVGNNGNKNNGNNNNGEPFQNTGPTSTQRKEMKQYVVLGLVIVAALAWNEGVKFMIGEQLKFNEGNNMYHIGYAVVSTLLAIVIYKMTI